MPKQTSIDVMATMCEPYMLEDINIREISLGGNEFDRTLYIKLQGINNKSHKPEQIKITFGINDSEDLARGINEVIKQGLFKKNE